jgi:hypothetical protein
MAISTTNTTTHVGIVRSPISFTPALANDGHHQGGLQLGGKVSPYRGHQSFHCRHNLPNPGGRS